MGSRRPVVFAGGLKKAGCVCGWPEECLWPAGGLNKAGCVCGWPEEGRLCLWSAGGLQKAGCVCGLRVG